MWCQQEGQFWAGSPTLCLSVSNLDIKTYRTICQFIKGERSMILILFITQQRLYTGNCTMSCSRCKVWCQWNYTWWIDTTLFCNQVSISGHRGAPLLCPNIHTRQIFHSHSVMQLSSFACKGSQHLSVNSKKGTLIREPRHPSFAAPSPLHTP